MNQSLNALLTKLNWQLNDLELNLNKTRQEIQRLADQINKIDKSINGSGFNSLIINPDLEINRLNFITQQHNQKEELISALNNYQGTESKLKEKIQRVKTELKMLENYLQRDQISKKEHLKKAHDNALDEWVIQKRESI